jgi:hypothetical protein
MSELMEYFSWEMLFVVFFIVVILPFVRKKLRGVSAEYSTQEGQLRREDVNKKYKLNALLYVFVVIAIVIYIAFVAGIIHEFGVSFFAIVLSVLVILPAAVIGFLPYAVIVFIAHVFNKRG